MWPMIISDRENQATLETPWSHQHTVHEHPIRQGTASAHHGVSGGSEGRGRSRGSRQPTWNARRHTPSHSSSSPPSQQRAQKYELQSICAHTGMAQSRCPSHWLCSKLTDLQTVLPPARLHVLQRQGTEGARASQGSGYRNGVCWTSCSACLQGVCISLAPAHLVVAPPARGDGQRLIVRQRRLAAHAAPAAAAGQLHGPGRARASTRAPLSPPRLRCALGPYYPQSRSG